MNPTPFDASSTEGSLASRPLKPLLIPKNAVQPGGHWELMVSPEQEATPEECLHSKLEQVSKLLGNYGIIAQDDQSGVWSGQQLLEHALFLMYACRLHEALQLLEEAQRQAHQQQDDLLEARVQIEAIWTRYLLHPEEEGSQTLRRLDEQLATLQRSYQRKQASELKGILLHYKGLVHYNKRNYGLALRFYREALSYTAADSLLTAQVFDSMAQHYERIGSYMQSFGLLNQSIVIKEARGVVHEQARTYELLGHLALLTENMSESLQYMDKALLLALQLKEPRHVASLRNDVIKLAILNKQLKKAEGLIYEAEKANESNSFWGAYATTLLYRAFLLYQYHQYQEAYTVLIEMAMPLFVNCQQETGYGVAHRLLGALSYVFGRRREALQHMQEAISVFKRQQNQAELAKTFFEQGKLYMEMNHTQLAEESFLRSLNLAETYGLQFILRSIEEELYIVAPSTWQQLMQHRGERQSLFSNKQRTPQKVLSQLKHAVGNATLFPEPEQELSEAQVLPSASEVFAAREAGDLMVIEGLDERFQVVSPAAFSSLFRLGLSISAERDLDNILHILREETTRALDADRCTVFVYDSEKDELWSKVASGLNGTETIRIPAGVGLAGHVLRLGEVLNIEDVYLDPRFNKEVDRKTGYRTKSLLCMPIHNRNNEPLGVIQVLNKRSGAFNQNDEDLLLAISSTASMTMENTLLATEQKRALDSFITTLSSAIDARDRITSGHSQRVANYAGLIGEEMLMTKNDMEALRYAAMLHDIGKIGIREEVLTKEGRLTVDEYKHIQEHARYTYEILKHIHFPKHLTHVPYMAATHHERVDGKGYFQGLRGDEIPMGGRIIALTDVFDAITSLRHYRNRMPFENVLKIFRKDSGSHFDHEVVDIFFRIPLYRLASILVQDQQNAKIADATSLIRYLDKGFTIADYEGLLSKKDYSNAEQKIHTTFSDIYYVMPNRGKLDHE